MDATSKRNVYIGVLLAILATIIWSGNFIVARGVSQDIPPVSLNFYRWLTASILLLPFAWKTFRSEKDIVYTHWKYLFATALTGIAVFNTLVYVAGHYSSAINLALIGTTTSPIFAILLAAVFLRERIRFLRVIGLVLSITGIILLLSQGSIDRLISFRFSTGDGWIIAAALFFAIYNTLVRVKPPSISPLTFLFVSFWMGTLVLIPFYCLELWRTAAVNWNEKMFGIIIYLGLGASLVAYLCWNAAIARLGSSRTALFSNLIPVFSALEAVAILNERIKAIHVVSGVLVLSGLWLANMKKANL